MNLVTLPAPPSPRRLAGTGAEGAEGPARILVIEDEESYREALAVALGNEGFVVELAADGTEGLRLFGERPPDLVLLDLMLPGLAGTEVCRRITTATTVPVIIVTALDTEVDVVLGLELGASDYVTKPFHLRELVARIQAVLRRSWLPQALHPHVEAPAHQEPEVIEAGPVVVDTGRRTVTHEGRPVSLSRLEFDLLVFLLTPPGKVRTRDELIDRLWTGRDLTDTRTLDTHIRRLRVKLEASPADPRHLLTVRGVGFRFDPEGAAD